MSTELLFDYLGIRLDGLRAAERTWSLAVTVTDRGEHWRVGIERGALHAVAVDVAAPAGAEVEVAATHAALAALVFGAGELADLEAAGDLAVTGDRAALEALVSVLDRFSLMFPIVEP